MLRHENQITLPMAAESCELDLPVFVTQYLTPKNSVAVWALKGTSDGEDAARFIELGGRTQPRGGAPL